MNWKQLPVIGAGIFVALFFDASGSLEAQTGGEGADIIVVKINTAKFSGRYSYEAAISPTCDFRLKEINPKCPDQRAEISFNMANIETEVDDLYGALVVKSMGEEKIIIERLYYRGPEVKGRRFCKAPPGSSLQSTEKKLLERRLFYSEDLALLETLRENFAALSEACRTKIVE